MAAIHNILIKRTHSQCFFPSVIALRVCFWLQVLYLWSCSRILSLHARTDILLSVAIVFSNQQNRYWVLRTWALSRSIHSLWIDAQRTTYYLFSQVEWITVPGWEKFFLTANHSDQVPVWHQQCEVVQLFRSLMHLLVREVYYCYFLQYMFSIDENLLHRKRQQKRFVNDHREKIYQLLHWQNSDQTFQWDGGVVRDTPQRMMCEYLYP